MISDEYLEKLAEEYADNCDIEKRFGGPRLEREIGFIAGFRAAEKMMAERFPTREEMKEIAKHEDSDGYFGFMSGYDWLKQKLLGDDSQS